MTDRGIFEPSFADAIAAIERATDLSGQARRQWTCSLRRIAKALDRPRETIPARWTAVWFPISRLHHARIGMTYKTLANHKSNAKSALLWFRKEKHLPGRGVRLAVEWERLRDQLRDFRRKKLSSLMRYCSARGIAPAAVDEAVFDSFMSYR